MPKHATSDKCLADVMVHPFLTSVTASADVFGRLGRQIGRQILGKINEEPIEAGAAR